MIFVCHYCQKTYKRQPSQAPITKYCSNKCRAADHKHPEIHCHGCNIMFNPTRKEQVYCTPRCRRKNFGKTRMHRVTKRCMYSGCGKPIEVQWSRRHRKNYCSIACRSAARRIKKRPSSEQLQHLVLYMTYKQISQNYNVCACTVMNWAKEYGIRSPSHKKSSRSPWRLGHTGAYIGELYGV